MAFKTKPAEIISQSTSISWKDADGDMVALPKFLEMGLMVNWNRPDVIAFRDKIRKEGESAEADKLYQLYISDQIMILRAPEIQAYFLIGDLVNEFRLLSKAARDYQESLGMDARNIHGCKIVFPEHLAEARPRHDELTLMFDQLVGLKIYIDEKDLKKDPKGIHYLFFKKQTSK